MGASVENSIVLVPKDRQDEQSVWAGTWLETANLQNDLYGVASWRSKDRVEFLVLKRPLTNRQKQRIEFEILTPDQFKNYGWDKTQD